MLDLVGRAFRRDPGTGNCAICTRESGSRGLRKQAHRCTFPPRSLSPDLIGTSYDGEGPTILLYCYIDGIYKVQTHEELLSPD